MVLGVVVLGAVGLGVVGLGAVGLSVVLGGGGGWSFVPDPAKFTYNT